MKKYLIAIVAMVLSLGMAVGLTACGDDEPKVITETPVKSDLVSPMFLYSSNSETSYIAFRSFTDTEAAYGTMTVVGDNTLRVQCSSLYTPWSLNDRTLTLGENRTYTVSVGNYNNAKVVTIEGTMCLPSNATVNGTTMEAIMAPTGITKQILWNAIREAYNNHMWSDITGESF